VDFIDPCTVALPDTTDLKEELEQEEESLEELRKKYVGEVDLPESASGCSQS
jgi:hypothetical protein